MNYSYDTNKSEVNRPNEFELCIISISNLSCISNDLQESIKVY